jgi:hypothetical protein
LNGIKINIIFNNGFSEWRGELTGLSMTGRSESKNGVSWTWQLKWAGSVTPPQEKKSIAREMELRATEPSKADPVKAKRKTACEAQLDKLKNECASAGNIYDCIAIRGKPHGIVYDPWRIADHFGKDDLKYFECR